MTKISVKRKYDYNWRKDKLLLNHYKNILKAYYIIIK